jgi:hypothetical protein
MARVIRVAGRHPFIFRHTTNVGCYVCKETVGTSLFSAHSFGDAGDFMLKLSKLEAEEGLGAEILKGMAERIVRDATHKTLANLGRRTRATFVIHGDRQWIAGKGWSHYGGVPHTNHVHVGCSFSVSAPKPLCAGGSAKLPGVKYCK